MPRQAVSGGPRPPRSRWRRSRSRSGGSCRASTVIGRSVFSRSVRHGTPRTVVSSWMPPESVRTRARGAEQRQELQVAERLDRGMSRRSACAIASPSALQRAPRCAGGPGRRRAGRGDAAQSAEQCAEAARVVDVGRSMEGHHGVAACASDPSAAPARARALGGRSRGSVSIITLPTKEHARVRDRPSRLQVLHAPLGSVTKRRSRDRVGQDPVDLLRHGAIEAAQPRLDVRHAGSPSFDRREGAGQRRVDVADDERRGRAVRRSTGSKRSRMLAVWTAWLAEPTLRVDVGLREREVREEGPTSAVVVLARVDQRHTEGRALLQRVIQRRELHPVGTGSTDEEDGLRRHESPFQ